MNSGIPVTHGVTEDRVYTKVAPIRSGLENRVRDASFQGG